MEANIPTHTPGPDSDSKSSIPGAPSLDELWAIVEPTLNEFMKAGSDVTTLPPTKYTAVYTLVYNYTWSFRINGNVYELSGKFDDYFGTIARQLLRDSPKSAADDQSLIRSTLDAFNHFKPKARYIGDRVFSPYNRHHVRQAKNIGQGWVTLDKEEEELEKWRFDQGASEEPLARTIASAEAGSSPNQVVPIGSAALRQFRLDFIEPLIRGGAYDGCLAKAIERLLDSEDVGGVDKRAIVQDLANMFKDIGVHYKHPLRIRLSVFLRQPDA